MKEVYTPSVERHAIHIAHVVANTLRDASHLASSSATTRHTAREGAKVERARGRPREGRARGSPRSRHGVVLARCRERRGAQELAEPARHTTPAGRYTVSVRLVEAKNLQAIQAFNFFQTLMSFKLKTQTVHADRLPNVVGKVYLERGLRPAEAENGGGERDGVAVVESVVLL